MGYLRGLFTLFTRETFRQQYRTAVFVTTVEPDVLEIVLPEMAHRFPSLSFTMVAPEPYAEVVQRYGKFWRKDDFRTQPLAALRALREQHFDVCVFVLSGRPTFFKTKLIALFLNTQRIFVFDENGNIIPLDRDHWGALLGHFLARIQRLRGGVLFFPFGFAYLLGRTAWLSTRAWRNKTPLQ